MPSKLFAKNFFIIYNYGVKSFNIGNVKIKSNAVLAPMAGFSDAALRSMAHEYGAGLSFTEMVSAKALLATKDAVTIAVVKNKFFVILLSF